MVNNRYSKVSLKKMTHERCCKYITHNNNGHNNISILTPSNVLLWNIQIIITTLRSNNLSETLYTIRKQQRTSLKQEQIDETDGLHSDIDSILNDPEEDDEKNKTSFHLGEGISPRDTVAVQSTVPVLEELKQTSIQKLKEFLMDSFKSFTTTKTNVQMLQQYLLKYKYYIIFLNMHSPSTYEEIVTTYTSKYAFFLYARLTNMRLRTFTNMFPFNNILVRHDGKSAP
jgi:hypothetical protein